MENASSEIGGGGKKKKGCKDERRKKFGGDRKGFGRTHPQPHYAVPSQPSGSFLLRDHKSFLASRIKEHFRGAPTSLYLAGNIDVYYRATLSFFSLSCFLFASSSLFLAVLFSFSFFPFSFPLFPPIISLSSPTDPAKNCDDDKNATSFIFLIFYFTVKVLGENEREMSPQSGSLAWRNVCGKGRKRKKNSWGKSKLEQANRITIEKEKTNKL